MTQQYEKYADHWLQDDLEKRKLPIGGSRDEQIARLKRVIPSKNYCHQEYYKWEDEHVIKELKRRRLPTKGTREDRNATLETDDHRQLVELLRRRNLPTYGEVADMIRRLEDDERNRNMTIFWTLFAGALLLFFFVVFSFFFVTSRYSGEMRDIATQIARTVSNTLRNAFEMLVNIFTSTSDNRASLREAVSVEMNQVLQTHPECGGRCRKVLNAAFDRWIVNEKYGGPVVVLLQLSLQSTFLHDLVTSAGKAVKHSKAKVIECDKDTKRTELHETLHARLQESESLFSTVGLHRIDSLKWDAPIVLQTFSDANKVEKYSPLLFMSTSEAVKGECEDRMWKHLQSTWMSSGGNRDNVPPIISRITQYTICLDEENEDQAHEEDVQIENPTPKAQTDEL